MNSFYQQPKAVQWLMAISLLLIGLFPALFIIEKGYSQPLYYFLFLVYLPIGQFSFTPFFRLVGVYNYYSPMLLGYMANDTQIDLHSGGSFDYLFVMSKFKAGIEMRNQLLIYHLEGLMSLIELIEHKGVPETVNIIGTSYFFNHRTMTKMGFSTEKPTLFYQLNLFVNFIDLIWMYSISKGRFSIPKLWNAQKATITGTQLIGSKKAIVELYEKMKIKAIA